MFSCKQRVESSATFNCPTLHHKRPQLLSLGSTGFAYKLNDLIVVKKGRPGRISRFSDEQAIFEKLENHALSPYIIRSFHRIPNVTFLEFAPCGDVASLLSAEQTRDGARVLSVAETQPLDLCYLWMKQLCSAAAWLESLGLCHCDIHPANMLLCSQWHMKLADFDRTLTIGEEISKGTEPFARLLGSEGGSDRGTYGRAGARTEQFAIGSVFYSLTRGYDLYEDEWWGPDHELVRMERLQNMEFPVIGALEADEIIWSCWHDQYETIGGLSSRVEELASLDETTYTACNEGSAWLTARRRECEEFNESGLLDALIVM
ncbi:hypothetical protein G7046_g4119 [Stylonectria norvegica]|nr:hypothetical protein G7046_g4119 [Stylonectria norvegica]